MDQPGYPLISVVVPAWNEAENLESLYQSVRPVLERIAIPWEMVIVDDGSTDATFAIIQRLHQQDYRVRGAQMRVHLGKGAVYATGFHLAKGDILLTMDADLQDDPEDLPILLAALGPMEDMVIGWKVSGKGDHFRSQASVLFNAIVSYLTGLKLHDVNCPLRAFRREVVTEVPLYGDLFRFLPVLAFHRGFRVVEVPVKNYPRGHGSSKFGLERYYRGVLDLLTVVFLTRFAKRPLHFIGIGGLLTFIAGFGINLFLLIAHLFYVFGADIDPSWDLHNRPMLMLGMLLLIFGAQFFSMGLLGELFISRGHGLGGVGDYPIRCRVPVE
ncbi:MAG: glycosyltransferase family 2 protein [Magnetococcus sp. DMHC-6]